MVWMNHHHGLDVLHHCARRVFFGITAMLAIRYVLSMRLERLEKKRRQLLARHLHQLGYFERSANIEKWAVFRDRNSRFNRTRFYDGIA